jgi:hypothetical protein
MKADSGVREAAQVEVVVNDSTTGGPFRRDYSTGARGVRSLCNADHPGEPGLARER